MQSLSLELLKRHLGTRFRVDDGDAVLMTGLDDLAGVSQPW